jgi:hypothetical protein
MPKSKLRWAMPGIVFLSAFTLSAACGSNDDTAPAASDCTTSSGSGSGGSSPSGVGATTTSGGATTTTSGGSTSSGGNSNGPSASEVAARLHGCRKIRYDSLGSLLTSRGVDAVSFGGSLAACELNPGANDPKCSNPDEFCYCAPGKDGCVDVGNEDGDNGVCVTKPQTAGFLYQSGEDAFAVPKPDSRQGEKDEHTSASALRLMDIFIQAAPQIIANIDDPSKAPACQINGQTWPMFASDGSCVEEAVSCIIGSPATSDHMLLCNLIVDKANANDPVDLEKKQIIAVAALMSAAHTCE